MIVRNQKQVKCRNITAVCPQNWLLPGIFWGASRRKDNHYKPVACTFQSSCYVFEKKYYHTLEWLIVEVFCDNFCCDDRWFVTLIRKLLFNKLMLTNLVISRAGHKTVTHKIYIWCSFCYCSDTKMNGFLFHSIIKRPEQCAPKQRKASTFAVSLNIMETK